jgi:hypothetical protein
MNNFKLGVASNQNRKFLGIFLTESHGSPAAVAAVACQLPNP